ncbi:hypothetical protein CEXT_43971 [Caerostris extrusa]|uniref:Uncharacterized protein n=1 Tax=Caerostris extrusa TaxID=172846 RepID=A0AAV4NA61_CAEEX|nr:hypothetical protein CEXT_43971 [Caerostris extrusa]
MNPAFSKTVGFPLREIGRNRFEYSAQSGGISHPSPYEKQLTSGARAMFESKPCLVKRILFFFFFIIPTFFQPPFQTNRVTGCRFLHTPRLTQGWGQQFLLEDCRRHMCSPLPKNEWSKGPEDSLSGVILKSQIGSDFGPVDSFARQKLSSAEKGVRQ